MMKNKSLIIKMQGGRSWLRLTGSGSSFQDSKKTWLKSDSQEEKLDPNMTPKNLPFNFLFQSKF